jgi:hypothetical protein
MTATDSSNNNNALTSILQMCKECDSSNISMIRTLVLKALTSPDIFAGFDEIKTAVQPALASAAPDILRTLDLFSYGTYKDVSAGGFLSLTDAQLQKLRMLTVVTLVERACCEQQNGIVPYSTVAQELSLAADTLESNRQVEEIIIACIYAGIVRGKLCQKTRSLVVSSQNGPPCAPRDVQQVSSMLKSLKELQANLLSTIMTMEADKHNVEKRREAHAEFVKRAKEASAGRNTRAAAGGGGNNSRGREMDIRMRRQKRSRGAGGPMAAGGGGGDGFPRM